MTCEGLAGGLLLRGLFVGLAALALATQAARGTAGPGDVDDFGVAFSPAALGLKPAGPVLADGTLPARAEGCTEPVLLARLRFDELVGGNVRALLDTGADPRFAYLGYVAPRPGTLAILTRWAVAIALHTVGLRRAAPPQHVVLAMLPRVCPELAGRDWSRLSPWR